MKNSPHNYVCLSTYFTNVQLKSPNITFNGHQEISLEDTQISYDKLPSYGVMGISDLASK